MTDEANPAWAPQEIWDWANQQAQNIRDAAAMGGLRFQAYLPPELALWLLDRIEQGTFVDPSEAAFVLIDEAREMEPHLDLRQELLKRRILRAADHPQPSISADEFFAMHEATRMKPHPEPAVWLPKQKD